VLDLGRPFLDAPGPSGTSGPPGLASNAAPAEDLDRVVHDSLRRFVANAFIAA
jgi:hypothetical protein